MSGIQIYSSAPSKHKTRLNENRLHVYKEIKIEIRWGYNQFDDTKYNQ